jgi:hypothetical protein
MLAALLAPIALVAAVQQVFPAPEAAVDHVRDCIAATRADGVDLTLLEQRGWKRAALRSSDGPVPFAMFSRESDMSFLTASTALTRKIECLVMIPTDGIARAETVRDALSSALAVQPEGGLATGMTWRAGEHRLTLTPLGGNPPKGIKIVVTVEKK